MLRSPPNGSGEMAVIRAQGGARRVAAEQQPVDRVGDVDQADHHCAHGVELHGPDGQLDQAVGDGPPGHPVPQPLVDPAEDPAARWNLGGASTRKSSSLPGQPPVQRAQAAAEPGGQGQQQQPDDRAQHRDRDGQAEDEHDQDDPEPDQPGRPADPAVQQLTHGPAGERGTQDGARHPPDVLAHVFYCSRYASRRLSAHAPMASAAAAYRHSRANETPGERVCGSGFTAVSEFSAMSIGMYGSTALFTASPNGRRISGSANKTPAQGRDRPGGVPDHRAQADAEQRGDQRRVGARHQHRPQHPGLAQRGVRGRGPQHRLAHEERGEGQDLPRDQRHRGHDGRLGRQHQRAPRRGRERGPDHSGGELPGHHQHAQDAEGELAHGQPAKLSLVGSNVALSAAAERVP